MNGNLPAIGAVSLPAIPDELKGYNQWVVWRYEKDPNPKAKKPRKVPYSPISLKSTGPDEASRPKWGSFDQAVTAYNSGNFSGIGFVFNPYLGVDLDNCAFDGQPDSWAEGVIDQLNTYTEVSPSGTGFHMLLVGKKPGARCKPPRKCLVKNKAGDFVDDIEIYDSGRYFTVTGKVFQTAIIEQHQEQLIDVYREQIERDQPQLPDVPQQPAPRQQSSVTGSGGIQYDQRGYGQPGYWKIPDEDKELFDEIEKSKQKDKFFRWFSGDLSMNGGDHSSADLGFCGALVFWTGKNAERMDQIFRTSRLMRPKWDEMRGALPYGQMTINLAIKQCKDVYKGKWVSDGPPPPPAYQAESNVVDITTRKAKGAPRTVHITETGFDSGQPLFNEEALEWPDTGSYFHISPTNGALYQGNSAEDGKSEIIALRPIWIYSIEEDEQEEVYRVIKFYDHNLKLKEICVPSQWFSKTKDANVWSALLAQGMQLMSGKEKFVARYLDMAASQCKKRSWAAAKLGWFEVPSNEEKPVFVLPHTVLGDTGDNREVFFQQLKKTNGLSFSPKGSLVEWKREVADRAKGNSLIRLSSL